MTHNLSYSRIAHRRIHPASQVPPERDTTSLCHQQHIGIMLSRIGSQPRASAAVASLVRPRSGPASSVAACCDHLAPSLSALSLGRPMSTSTATATATSQEIVTFLTLNNISDNAGAIKRKRRVGRGIGSSKGKTSGRGHKGQKARAGGGVHPSFEGGQTKLYKRMPKRGFTNVHAEDMVPINVGTLQDYVDMGRLVPPSSPSDPPLTIRDLVDAGITKASSVKHGVKLLAKGMRRVRDPLRIQVSRASAKAIAAVEAVGGEVTTVHYNRLALRALLKPEKFEGKVLPRQARPPPKLMPYYTSYDKRGFLSPELQLRKVEERLAAAKVDGNADGT